MSRTLATRKLSRMKNRLILRHFLVSGSSLARNSRIVSIVTLCRLLNVGTWFRALERVGCLVSRVLVRVSMVFAFYGGDRGS